MPERRVLYERSEMGVGSGLHDQAEGGRCELTSQSASLL